MLNRRSVLKSVSVLALTPSFVWSNDESPLIYLSPLQTGGELSRCQAEIWFVTDGGDFCVVTAFDAWRAEAVAKGLTRAKVWMGDVGQWQSSNGKYKTLPSVETNVRVETDATAHARVLNQFGQKYSAEWGTWGPRFKRGLADGSRVMIRYRPV